MNLLLTADFEEVALLPECRVMPLSSLGGERRSYKGYAQPFVPHSHEHYVIGCVRQGCRRLSLNGRKLSIAPGDLIAFNPGDVHGCEHASDELFSYDSITIAADVLEGAILDIPSASEEQAELRATFDETLSLVDASRLEEAEDRIHCMASMLETSSRTPYQSMANEEAAVAAYAHLRSHLAAPLSIRELAASHNISEYALIRAYRKRFAITPLQHLLAFRVDCACELLAQGATPSVAAAETGFSDQAHMTRIFKQRIGTTPAAYARMATARGERA